jgi:hypothetical protein
MSVEVAAGRVRVVVAHSPRQLESVRVLIAAAGGEVEDEAVSALGALVPIPAIEELVDHAAVQAMRIPRREE